MYFVRRSIRTLIMIVCTSAVFAGLADAQTASNDIVLWTSTVPASDLHGDWTRMTDPLAAGGALVANPDRNRGRIAPALASPQNYFEMRFSATRATAYHLWIRMRAQDNSRSNDSVHVQFSDSVNAQNQPIIRIGTASSTEPILQAGPSGGPVHGWGWTDNGWGSLGSPIYFAADGTHTIRVQQREDGPRIDQIVLSPTTFATRAPGERRDDDTILPAAGAVTGSSSTPTSPSSSTIVIRPATAAAGRTYGSWQVVSDSTAAGGQAIRNPDRGASRIAPALTNPVSYFEATFTASAGRAYHVWVRMRADGDSLSNDSVHIQFNDSLTTSGSPVVRIGTTSSLEMALQAGPNATYVRGWGWTDNGWGSLGPNVMFASTGTHTIRVQQREDGPRIDQIVISPDTYLTTAPGSRVDDRTILAATSTSPTSNAAPTVTLTSPASGATFASPASITMSANASDPENRLARVEFYNGSTRLATDTTAPFTYTWGSVPAGTYQLRAMAFDADGGSATSATATVTVGSTSTVTRRVAFMASPDHAIVTQYVLEIYLPTGIPGVTIPLATSNLGRPTPNSSNEIIVDQTTFLGNLLAGLYQATVTAVGSGGSSRSAAITFTR
jgi:hypothetical protein